MKTLLLFMMLLMPVIVYAEPCPDIEYAKLKDMSQASIEEEYCKTIIKMKLSMSDWANSINDTTAKEIKSCDEITDKMQRVYKERFKGDIPSCHDYKAKAKE